MKSGEQLFLAKEKAVAFPVVSEFFYVPISRLLKNNSSHRRRSGG